MLRAGAYEALLMISSDIVQIDARESQLTVLVQPVEMPTDVGGDTNARPD